jgi:hypothetical protein
MKEPFPRLRWLAALAAALTLVALASCASHYMPTQSPQKTIGVTETQMKETQVKAKGLSPATFRQASVKKQVSAPLPQAYEAAQKVLSIYEPVADFPAKLTADAGQINYADNEPIYHNRKDLGCPPITVTIFLEVQGPQTTMVYFYPHHRLLPNIPPDLLGVVEANMDYRGTQFLYRLETQLSAGQRWGWLK